MWDLVDLCPLNLTSLFVSVAVTPGPPFLTLLEVSKVKSLDGLGFQYCTDFMKYVSSIISGLQVEWVSIVRGCQAVIN